MLTKTKSFLYVNDKASKPVVINQYIGRRSVFCCVNSDGDHGMLQYATINNSCPSLGLIVRHTAVAHRLIRAIEVCLAAAPGAPVVVG